MVENEEVTGFLRVAEEPRRALGGDDFDPARKVEAVGERCTVAEDRKGPKARLIGREASEMPPVLWQKG